MAKREEQLKLELDVKYEWRIGGDEMADNKENSEEGVDIYELLDTEDQMTPPPPN